MNLKFATKLSFLALSVLLLFGCEDEKSPIEVNVRAVNEQNRAITNAHVYLNETFEGRTNSQGYLSFKKNININDRIFFEIKKESESLYYAPYYENLILAPNTSTITINATLYSVPKPHFSDENEKNENNAIAETENSSNAGVGEEPEPLKEEKKQISPSSIKVKDLNVSKSKKPKVEIATPKITKIEDPKDSEGKKGKKKSQEIEISNQAPKEKIVEIDPITFYINANKGPVAGAEIFYANKINGDMSLACKTNKRGRCQLQKVPKDASTAMIIVKKQGYVSKTRVMDFSPGAKEHISLERGYSIDIQTLRNHYGHQRGLQGVVVEIDGRLAGKTDEYGIYIGHHRGGRGDLVEVTLKSSEHIPEVFSTDYIIGGNVSLKKYFGTINPEPVRVSTIPVQVAGRLQGKTLSTFTGSLDKFLKRSFQKNFFDSPAFISTNSDAMIQGEKPKDLIRYLKKGWRYSPAKSEIDAVLVPTIIMHDPMTLELSVIDSTGKVLAAGKEDIKRFNDTEAIAKAVKALSEKIVRRFPFEGTIVAEESGLYKINLGFGEGRDVKVGDIFDVYGLQSDLKGQSKIHTRIGKVQVTHAMEYSSRVKVIEKKSRAAIEVGDQVTFKGQGIKARDVIQFVVSDAEQKSPVSQANIYFAGTWIGSTNANGILKTNKHDTGRGLLKIIKHGYENFSKETKLGTRGRVEIPLKRVSAYVQVDSDPQGMSVFIDKRFVGKTPIEEAIGIPSGFAKLEILGQDGYKNHMQILELDEGTLDLTGERKIKMEKDFQTEAKTLVDNGKFKQAIDILNTIPESHSDYLDGRHFLGVIYMTLTNEPAKAAEAFHQVTSHPEVKSFRAKRFIGSHVNEGVSLYLTAKNLMKAEEKETAIAHYIKSLEVLGNTELHLRFIAKSDYQQAYDNLHYYTALSHQDLWNLSNSQDHLLKAQASWQKLLEGRDSKTRTPLIKNAKIYLKQVEVAINQNLRRNL